MGKTIAVAGKGGVGKTSISSLLIQELARNGLVLAIDADPSTNLHQSLGLPLRVTIGGVREGFDEQVRKGTFSAGVTKREFLDLKVREALVESDRVDLLAMGRPEGPGCYCAVNNMLRTVIDHIEENYDYVVIDSEAGMEHISRQTTKDLDHLLIVTDPTMRGLTAAFGILDLIDEIRTDTGCITLIVNRVAKGLSSTLKDAIDQKGFRSTHIIGVDPALYDLETEGLPLSNLPLDSELRSGVLELITALGL